MSCCSNYFCAGDCGQKYGISHVTEPFNPKKKVHAISEADVESDHVAAVKADGGHSYKFTSPARRAVPDRLDLRPVPPEHQEIVKRYVQFTELKRPGEKATTAQAREHKALRDLGFFVQVIDQRTK